MPGVPIPTNDEVGDLATRLNETCRAFATANQELIYELRSAAQNDRAQSLFLRETSRELRAPLDDIANECLLLRDANLNPSQSEDVQVIEDAGQQLAGHVEEIIKLSGLENWHELPLNRSAFDLGRLAGDVLNKLSDRASPDVATELGLADDVLPIWADRNRIRQVLENLIDNALKFTENGYVRVTLVNSEFDDGRPATHLQVWDSGPGVPEADRHAIFGEFYRVPDQRDVPGTGLGLAIAHRLVEKHGGKLWVESVVGEGSVFHLMLPQEGAS